MEKPVFMVRLSNRTFEPYSGMGYVDAGGTPEQLIPLESEYRWFDLYLKADGYLRDESGAIVGCRFKESEDGKVVEVRPGEVAHLNAWADCVDDDGCPESVCISYYIELLPFKAVQNT